MVRKWNRFSFIQTCLSKSALLKHDPAFVGILIYWFQFDTFNLTHDHSIWHMQFLYGATGLKWMRQIGDQHTEGSPFTIRNHPVKTQTFDFLYIFACNTSQMQFSCNIRLSLAFNHDKQILSGFLWVFSNKQIAKIWWKSSVSLQIGVG